MLRNTQIAPLQDEHCKASGTNFNYSTEMPTVESHGLWLQKQRSPPYCWASGTFLSRYLSNPNKDINISLP
jgi:hypothetical protein